MRIALCYMSIGERYRQITECSRINKLEYCNKHDYVFIEDNSVYNQNKPIPWSKLLLINRYLNQFDYLVWVDADILIMNPEIKIESFIEKYSNYDLICGSDWKMINTGFMIIKNTDFSRNFIDKVYNNEYDPMSSGERYQNWEQGSFIHLHDNNYLNCKERIKVTEPIEMNSYWFNFYLGHFVIHFAGVRGELLDEVLKKYYPSVLPNDTQETYDNRMRWLRTDMRKEADRMMELEREGHMKKIEEDVRQKGDLELYTSEQLNNTIKTYETFIKQLRYICDKYGKVMEEDIENRYNNILSACKKESHILQIGGFKCGMTTLMFLIANKNNKVFCFDELEPYSKECYEYLKSIFPPERLELFNGETLGSLEQYSNKYNLQADVISIYSLDPRFVNIHFFTTLPLSKKDGLMILHEYGNPPLSMLWSGYIRDNHIKQLNVLPVKVQGHTIGKYLREYKKKEKPNNIYTRENIDIFKLKLSEKTICLNSKIMNKDEHIYNIIQQIKTIKDKYKDMTICVLDHTFNLEEKYQEILSKHCDYLLLTNDDTEPNVFMSLNNICSMYMNCKMKNTIEYY